jgi:hypothetical protein
MDCCTSTGVAVIATGAYTLAVILAIVLHFINSKCMAALDCRKPVPVPVAARVHFDAEVGPQTVSVANGDSGDMYIDCPDARAIEIIKV